ncbi:C2 domain-containing protein [Baffinella frigidus]|nr:C2 domain-containing protein [Cryptophyta sp. CCMP2293]
MAKGGKLSIFVHSGRDLPKMDRFGKSDPYVVVEVDGQKRTTKTMKKTLNPVWKEQFDIRVADSVTSVVTFTCFDWDFADDHDFMGIVEVKIEALLDRDMDQ